MVSKGQFVGLDWNRITRLHSQVMTGTHAHQQYLGFGGHLLRAPLRSLVT